MKSLSQHDRAQVVGSEVKSLTDDILASERYVHFLLNSNLAEGWPCLPSNAVLCSEINDREDR